jgi:hypothetical protein
VRSVGGGQGMQHNPVFWDGHTLGPGPVALVILPGDGRGSSRTAHWGPPVPASARCCSCRSSSPGS